MSLPRQVQEAQERVDRMLEERQGAGKPAEDQAGPLGSGDEAAQPREEPAQSHDRTDWKARYHVLQGKYNAEVPRYAAEVRELNQKLANAQGQIAHLQSKQAATPERPAEPDPGLMKLKDEYGPEFTAAIEKLVAERADEIVKPLQSKVDAAEREREQLRLHDEAQRRSRDFSEAVNDLVPDWESIDSMPEFHDYLAADGGDGRTRQEALMDAASRFDAAGAARIFTAFKRSDAYRRSAPAVNASSARTALESKIVPEASGTDRQPNSGARFYGRDEISGFYRNLREGKLNPEQARQIERDIEAAMREGRIR